MKHNLSDITFSDVAMFYLGSAVMVTVTSECATYVLQEPLHFSHFNMLHRVKPHLRPLHTAEREEHIAIGKLLGYTKGTPEKVLATRGKNFTIGVGTIQLTSVAEMSRLTAYLCRQRFDVFNLIENKQAFSI